MQSTFKREKIAEGVYFSYVTDPKFYSNRLSVNLVTRLDEKSAAVNAIVPAVLRLGCRSCPDFTALNRRLGLLYGAQLDGGAAAFGEYQILSVFAKGLDQRCTLHGEDMVGALCDLLCDVVLDPLVEDGAFTEAYTRLERTNLVDTIESEINDKRIWAQAQCMSLLFGDSPRAVRPYGSVPRAREITRESAYAAYQALLREARVEILFVGSGDCAGAKALFAARFGALPRLGGAAQDPSAPAFPQEKRARTEEMEVSQSKLVLAFGCAPQNEKEVFALRMMSAMYGGTPFSKLFLNVREKLSLCYYCSARYDRGNRVVLVSSGVEKEKKDDALDEILRQLEALRAGDFTDEELHNTVLAMNTGFAATGDSLYALNNWYLTQILSGSVHAPAEERDGMAAVTREEIVSAARSVALKAEYFLTSPNAKEA